MKRDDVIAGIVGGTIFVAGCVVGFFGYLKMNDIPLNKSMNRVEANDDSIDVLNNPIDSNDRIELKNDSGGSSGIEEYVKTIFPESEGWMINNMGQVEIYESLFEANIGFSNVGSGGQTILVDRFKIDGGMRGALLIFVDSKGRIVAAGRYYDDVCNMTRSCGYNLGN